MTDTTERGIASGREGEAGTERWAERPTSGTALGLGADGWVDGAGARLHVVTRGRADAPPVVLLHGFPDVWYAWRHQLPALDAAGFRAVAPDLRGYNLSACPPRVEDYALDLLADDVAAVIGAHAGADGRAHLVGHDWGGLIAWHVAARHPALVDRLVIVNAPHPARFRELLASSSQALRSWYVAFFQLPRVPELLLGANGRALLLRTLRTMHLRAGAFTRDDAAVYDTAFATPGALRAAVDYYRAFVRRGTRSAADGVPLPHRTLLLWGMGDTALLPENSEGLERWVPDLRVRRVPDAGHWVMADAPDVTNAALVEFLGAP
jgi:pimeloyl-ACP methyl ester carboxylesterase